MHRTRRQLRQELDKAGFVEPLDIPPAGTRRSHCGSSVIAPAVSPAIIESML
jgi:hypothetical protein